MNPNKYNAKKTTYNDINFDSKLEADFAQFLDKHGVPYTTHEKFILMEGFELKYQGNSITQSETIRPMTYEADFLICDKIIVDVKGNQSTQTEQFNIKWKLLKNMYREKYLYIKVENRLDFINYLGLIKIAIQK